MILAALMVPCGLAAADALAAEPVAQFACVLDRVSPADRRAYGRASPDAAALASISARVRTYAAACAARFGWDETRQRIAGAYTLAAIARDSLREHLAANRVDVAVIDHWAESYADWSDAMDNDDVVILHARLVNAGVSPERIARFTGAISEYLAARETIAAISVGRSLPGERE